MMSRTRNAHNIRAASFAFENAFATTTVGDAKVRRTGTLY